MTMTDDLRKPLARRQLIRRQLNMSEKGQGARHRHPARRQPHASRLYSPEKNAHPEFAPDFSLVCASHTHSFRTREFPLSPE